MLSGTQGRAEDKSGARRQGTCLGTAPGALKVMDMLRFGDDCGVCVCSWPQLVTQAWYLWGQAGSLLWLPVVCQQRPVSPILDHCFGWSCYFSRGKTMQTCLMLEKLCEKHSTQWWDCELPPLGIRLQPKCLFLSSFIKTSLKH